MQAIGSLAPAPRRNYVPTLLLLAVALLVTASTILLGAFALLPVFGVLLFALIVMRPEYGIALFLSTFLMTYPRALQGVGFLTINNVLGGIFLVLLVYKVYREDDWWFVRAPEMQLLAFIVMTFYLSIVFNAPDPQKVRLLGLVEHGAADFRTFVNRVAFVLFFINFIRTSEHVRMIYVLAMAFMVVTALTGMQSVLAGGGLYGYRATTEARIIAAAYNPNRLAMLSIISIAGLWYFMQSLRIPALRFLVIPNIVVLALTVFMTASRSGLLGLVVGVVTILVDQRANLRTVFNLSLAALLLLVLVAQFVPSRTLERITNLPGTEAGRTGEGAGSLERRQYTWEVAVELARENPILGVGMGNWELARFLKDPSRSLGAPHSSYLLALVEGGVFCLAGFLALLWRTWRNLRFAETCMADPRFRLADLLWIVKGAKAGFVVLIFFSIFADLWQFVILFWLVGLSVVIRRLVEHALAEEAAAH